MTLVKNRIVDALRQFKGLLAVLGLLIAIWPSNITRLYTHYADSMTVSGWMCVAAGYMVCTAAIHGTAIYAGIKRALDTGFVEE